MRACFSGPGPSRPSSCCSSSPPSRRPPSAEIVTARPPIVVQSSIRGVALGMTPTEVRGALGAPKASVVTPNPIVGKVRIWRYPGLRITFDGVGRDARCSP